MIHFPKDMASVIEVLKRLPHQKIAKGISIVLLIYIAYLCVQFTWLIFRPTETSTVLSAVTGNVKTEQNQGNKIKIQEFLSLNVFGLYNAVPEKKKVEVTQVQDAPETRLNLTLAGAVASDYIPAAIIENNGKQETYGIGDTITGTQATLDQVFADRVIIKHSGRLETLMLDGFNYTKEIETRKKVSTTPSQKKKQFVDKRSSKDFKEKARNIKRDLNKDPGKITDYLKVSPRREDGNIIGYQLRPGKDKAFFEAAGLKYGDVAIQMNGYDLSSPMEAVQAMQELKESKEISLLVRRDGDVTEILFSIDN